MIDFSCKNFFLKIFDNLGHKCFFRDLKLVFNSQNYLNLDNSVIYLKNNEKKLTLLFIII